MISEPLYQIPQAVLNELKSKKGNDRCFECESRNTDWGSVSMGTLLCIECAGKHRGYGVNVSFIRSLSLDTWSEQQLEMMRQGGNGRLRDYFFTLRRDEEVKSEKEDWDSLYTSEDADGYRNVLKSKVEDILKAGGGVSLPSGEVKVPATKESALSSLRRPSAESGDDCDDFVGDANRSRLSSGSGGDLYEDGATRIFTATFYGASIGITIKRAAGTQTPVISNVHPKSQAESKGVEATDMILSVNGVTMHKYEEVMKAIQRSPRPIRLTFIRGTRAPASDSPPAPQQRRKSSSLSELKNKPASLSLPKTGDGAQRSPGAGAVSTPSKTRQGASTGGNVTPRSNITPQKASSSSSPAMANGGSGGSGGKAAKASPSTPGSASRRSSSSSTGNGNTPKSKGGTGAPLSQQQQRRRSASGATITASGRSSPAGGTVPLSRRCHSEKGTKSTTPKTKRRTNSSSSAGSSSSATRKDKDLTTTASSTTSSAGAGSGYHRTLASLASHSVDSQESPSSNPSPRSRTSSVGEVSGSGSRIGSPIYGLEALGITNPGSPTLPSPPTPPPVEREEEEEEEGKPCEYRVVFPRAPLGLTVTRNVSTGTGWVSKVIQGGQAEQNGVELGDQLVGIDSKWVGSYEDAVADLSAQKYPMALVFRRNCT